MIARTIVVVVLVAACLAFSSSEAQEKLPPKQDLTALHGSLREVITTGADLFNLQGDYAGCYRLYQGSLIAVKPLLAGPQQANITKALAEADKKATTAEKAHHLRVAIDAVREQIKPAASPPIPLPPPIFKTPAAKLPAIEIVPVPPTKVKKTGP